MNEKLAGENIQNVLPHDLPAELRNVLVLLLQKYQNQWMAEATKDQVFYRDYFSEVSLRRTMFKLLMIGSQTFVF